MMRKWGSRSGRLCDPVSGLIHLVAAIVAAFAWLCFCMLVETALRGTSDNSSFKNDVAHA
jgi:hypothetical protein